MKKSVDEKHLISPFFIFFLIYSSTVGGVGIQIFQRGLFRFAGYDGWIAVLMVGASMHIILWMMYRILSSDSEVLDITAVNKKCFGNMIGNILNIAIVIFLLLGALTEFRSYIEIIQVMVFPEVGVLPLSIAFVLLIYYTVTGGFRSIAGLSFFGILVSYVMVIPLISFIIPYSHPLNLLPLFNHPISDLLNASKYMLYQYLGIEALLLFYPFIKNPKKSQKWGHLALLYITFFYTFIALITFMFFSEGQLRQLIWPTLQTVMIVELPIFQRLEYLAISVWIIKLSANVSLSLWAACRGMKNSLQMKPRVSLLIFLAGIAIGATVLKDYAGVQRLSAFYTTAGLYVFFVYIPVMFFFMEIKKVVQKRNKP